MHRLHYECHPLIIDGLKAAGYFKNTKSDVGCGGGLTTPEETHILSSSKWTQSALQPAHYQWARFQPHNSVDTESTLYWFCPFPTESLCNAVPWVLGISYTGTFG